MDTLTHALVGATLAHACQPSRISEQHLKLAHRVSLGAVAAAFPDIDYATYLIDPLYFISDWHRAETHSLILLPLWAIILALIFTQLTQQKPKLKEAFIICCLSLTSHITVDLMTSWGTQVFAPITDQRYALGISFVIDPYFTGIILTGLVLGLLMHKTFATKSALIWLVMYMAFQVTLKIQISNIANQQVMANNWYGAKIYTMPQPFSPFHWKIIISNGDNYYLSYVNLANRTYLPFLPQTFIAMIKHYHPENSLHWNTYSRYGNTSESKQIQNAWHQPMFEPYRVFARFPAFYSSDQSARNGCYWFIDLRYTLPILKPAFIYGMCRDLTGDSDWEVRQYNN